MRSDLLSNHLDVVGNLHHASTVHWRFSIKLSSYICIQGSLYGMPQSLEIALHTLFIQFLWRTFVYSSDVELQLMDVVDDIMTHVVTSLVYWNK
jgi:hypothetical protein